MPLPIPGALPNPGIKPTVLVLPAMASAPFFFYHFTTAPPEKPNSKCTTTNPKEEKQKRTQKLEKRSHKIMNQMAKVLLPFSS